MRRTPIFHRKWITTEIFPWNGSVGSFVTTARGYSWFNFRFVDDWAMVLRNTRESLADSSSSSATAKQCFDDFDDAIAVTKQFRHYLSKWFGLLALINALINCFFIGLYNWLTSTGSKPLFKQLSCYDYQDCFVLRPSDAIWRDNRLLTVVQVMTCPWFNTQPLPGRMVMHCKLNYSNKLQWDFNKTFPQTYHTRKYVGKCPL